MRMTIPSVSPNLGLNWNASAGQGLVSQWNRLTRYVEYMVSEFMVSLLFPDGIIYASAERCQINSTTKRITAPSTDRPLLALCGGIPICMYSEQEQTGTVTAGATTYITSTALPTAWNDYWVGAYIVFTSGVNSGTVRAVTQYTESTKMLQWSSVLTAPSPGDTFTVTFFYISGLTNSAKNYVYGTVSSSTRDYQYCTWSANTTGIKDTNTFLVGTLTLDGSGVATAVDNSPVGADRTLYANIGGYDEVTSVYVLSNIDGGEEIEVTFAHDELLYVGDLWITSDSSLISYTISAHYKNDEVVALVTNEESYADNITVTLHRTGRKKTTLNQIEDSEV